MKFYKIVTLVIFASSAVLASDKPASDKQKFSAAYKQYQTCVEKKDYTCTEQSAEKAYKLGMQVFAKDGKNVAALSYNYGLAVLDNHDNYRRMERQKKAYHILEEALPLNKKNFGKESEQVLALLIDLMRAQEHMSAEVKAHHKYGRAAIKLSKKLNGEDSLEHAHVLMQISNVMLHGNNYSNQLTRKYIEQAREIFTRELGEGHPYTGFMAFNIAKYELATKKYKRAEEDFNQALTAFEKDEGYRNRFSMAAHGYLVEVYEELGESDKATEHCLAIGRNQPLVPSEDYYPIFKRAPEYPSLAANKKLEGYVTVEYTVNEMGFTENIVLVENQGSKVFIQPSIKAAEQFRYAPQFVDGKATKVEGVRNRFTFKMSR